MIAVVPSYSATGTNPVPSASYRDQVRVMRQRVSPRAVHIVCCDRARLHVLQLAVRPGGEDGRAVDIRDGARVVAALSEAQQDVNTQRKGIDALGHHPGVSAVESGIAVVP